MRQKNKRADCNVEAGRPRSAPFFGGGHPAASDLLSSVVVPNNKRKEPKIPCHDLMYCTILYCLAAHRSTIFLMRVVRLLELSIYCRRGTTGDEGKETICFPTIDVRYASAHNLRFTVPSSKRNISSSYPLLLQRRASYYMFHFLGLSQQQQQPRLGRERAQHTHRRSPCWYSLRPQQLLHTKTIPGSWLQSNRDPFTIPKTPVESACVCVNLTLIPPFDAPGTRFSLQVQSIPVDRYRLSNTHMNIFSTPAATRQPSISNPGATHLGTSRCHGGFGWWG